MIVCIQQKNIPSFGTTALSQVSIYEAGAHKTFLSTQFTWEAYQGGIGRGEVGITGYQTNIHAC